MEIPMLTQFTWDVSSGKCAVIIAALYVLPGFYIYCLTENVDVLQKKRFQRENVMFIFLVGICLKQLTIITTNFVRVCLI